MGQHTCTYQVVTAKLSTITELGQEEHPINIPKKTEGKEETSAQKSIDRKNGRKKKKETNNQEAAVF